MNEIDLIEIESTFKPNKEINNKIQEGWKKAKLFMKENNHSFYNGNLLRFEKNEENKIFFSRSIKYKDVIGLRKSNYKLNQISKENNPCALSAIAIIKTSDNKILFRIRDEGDWEKSLELPGGFIREDEKTINESILNRLSEDLSLTKKNFLKMEFKKIYEMKSICEVMCVFEFITSKKSTEIKKENLIFINNIEKLKNTKEKLHKPSLEIFNDYLKC